jgi:Ca-activated chloride channel family protein
MPIELKISPRKSALLLGHDNMLEVLVRAVGPALPATAQPKKSVNLALVIDKSGSMSGRPLAEAKRCAATIVDQLGPDDFVSVVAYDGDVQVVWPASQVSDPEAVKRAIVGIASGGSTALHGGWAAGAEQAATNVGKAAVSRVLLLSDGCATDGIKDVSTIASHCAQMAATGVGTSTYGLGTNFNEQLMQAMARAGGGNAYYGQSASDLMGPFQEEFDLLQALYARDLRLILTPGPGVDLIVANSLTRLDGDWRLPDVAYGSEAWAMVRIRVPRSVAAAGEHGPIRLLRAELTYTADARPQVTEPLWLDLPAFPIGAHVALAEDDLVVRRSQEVRFAEFQEQASHAARAGDWERVDRVLESARTAAAGNDWLNASMVSLERYAALRDRARFSKEASFKAARMMSRIVESDELADYGRSSEDLKATYLRRKFEEGRSGDGAN